MAESQAPQTKLVTAQCQQCGSWHAKALMVATKKKGIMKKGATMCPVCETSYHSHNDWNQQIDLTNVGHVRSRYGLTCSSCSPERVMAMMQAGPEQGIDVAFQRRAVGKAVEIVTDMIMLTWESRLPILMEYKQLMQENEYWRWTMFIEDLACCAFNGYGAQGLRTLTGRFRAEQVNLKFNPSLIEWPGGTSYKMIFPVNALVYSHWRNKLMYGLQTHYMNIMVSLLVTHRRYPNTPLESVIKRAVELQLAAYPVCHESLLVPMDGLDNVYQVTTGLDRPLFTDWWNQRVQPFIQDIKNYVWEPPEDLVEDFDWEPDEEFVYQPAPGRTIFNT